MKLFSKVEAIVFTFLSITSDVMGNVIYPQFKCLSTKLNSCLSGVKGPSIGMERQDANPSGNLTHWIEVVSKHLWF